MDTKICKDCLKEKTLIEFPKASTTKDGYDTACKQCRVKRCMQNYYARRQKGLCPQCGTKALDGSIYCLNHWFRQVANGRLSHATMEDMKNLKALWIAQNKLCSYTNAILIPGHNMSLDHIKPVSRFPELKDDLNNLQWVTLQVNKAKGNMTHGEFINLCKIVIQKCT